MAIRASMLPFQYGRSDGNTRRHGLTAAYQYSSAYEANASVCPTRRQVGGTYRKVPDQRGAKSRYRQPPGSSTAYAISVPDTA
eukprot:2245703-Rhodomonas_salina.2